MINRTDKFFAIISYLGPLALAGLIFIAIKKRPRFIADHIKYASLFFGTELFLLLWDHFWGNLLFSSPAEIILRSVPFLGLIGAMEIYFFIAAIVVLVWLSGYIFVVSASIKGITRVCGNRAFNVAKK